jgi:5-methylcytosine-specific restriction endonuclease McrA
MISQNQLLLLNKHIDNDTASKFYSWHSWQDLRLEVLRLDNYECQRCKAAGRYRRGEIIHHVKHLKDRPDLAMSIFDPSTGERQLITVCKQCHEELHPESLKAEIVPAEPLTLERWD